MANSRNSLKAYFETGKKPIQSNFEELIDSLVHKDEDRTLSVQPIDVNNDEKFVTPKVAKMVVDAHAVKKVNGVSPDSTGNVAINNVSGTASTITGNITKAQVTGLQTDLDSKLNTNNLRTINGNSLVGTTNLVIGGNTPLVLSEFLTAIQTVTGAGQTTLNGNVFTIPPGKSAVITGILCYTCNSTTSGATYGIKVQQQNGGVGNAIGSWSVEVGTTALTSSASVRDGNSFTVAPNNTGGGEVAATVSTTPTTGNISATLTAIVKNTSSTLATTITITLGPSTATAVLSAQIGSGTIVMIS